MSKRDQKRNPLPAEELASRGLGTGERGPPHITSLEQSSAGSFPPLREKMKGGEGGKKRARVPIHLRASG